MPAHGPECVIRVIVKRKGSGGFCRKDEPFSLRRCASRFHKKTSGIRMNHLQKKPVSASPRHRMQARKALADRSSNDGTSSDNIFRAPSQTACSRTRASTARKARLKFVTELSSDDRFDLLGMCTPTKQNTSQHVSGRHESLSYQSFLYSRSFLEPVALISENSSDCTSKPSFALGQLHAFCITPELFQVPILA